MRNAPIYIYVKAGALMPRKPVPKYKRACILIYVQIKTPHSQLKYTTHGANFRMPVSTIIADKSTSICVI